jgi:hypothetical protein
LLFGLSDRSLHFAAWLRRRWSSGGQDDDQLDSSAFPVSDGQPPSVRGDELAEQIEADASVTACFLVTLLEAATVVANGESEHSLAVAR